MVKMKIQEPQQGLESKGGEGEGKGKGRDELTRSSLQNRGARGFMSFANLLEAEKEQRGGGGGEAKGFLSYSEEEGGKGGVGGGKGVGGGGGKGGGVALPELPKGWELDPFFKDEKLLEYIDLFIIRYWNYI